MRNQRSFRGSTHFNQTITGQYQGKYDGAWLQARLPALYGPHCDRPWAQVLRVLAYGDMRD